MTGLSLPTKRIMFVIGISALVIILGGVILCLVLEALPSAEALPFVLGVLLMSALNILKIQMLERTVKRTIEMEDANIGKNYVRLQYLLRYFLTGAILVVAALTPFINIWGAILGVFTLQIALFSVRFMKFDDNVKAAGNTSADENPSTDENTSTDENMNTDGNVNTDGNETAC